MHKFNRTFLIGEIGINHNGDIKIAEELIKKAKLCDFDAVKFQKRDIDTVYSQKVLSEKRESPFGTTQREQKEGLEFGEKEYDIIDNICQREKIEWFASAWDIKSLNFLKKYNCKYNKVASVMITHEDLLNEISKEKKFTFISTGMSEEHEIDNAVKIFKKNDCEFALLHCNSTYPCPPEDLNLSYIHVLKKKYNCIVGYSGHESNVSPSFASVILGAEIVERHITLDRAMYGSDQSASLQFDGMRALSEQIRNYKKILGNGKKTITNSEKKVRDKLRYW
tara:strand:+ start:873 stop:1712 length:840 start_codon:yes stop_codon:yes gene_type:complete